MQDVKYNGISGSSIGVFLKERPPIPAARRRKEEYEIPGKTAHLRTQERLRKEEIKLKFKFISKVSKTGIIRQGKRKNGFCLEERS